MKNFVKHLEEKSNSMKWKYAIKPYYLKNNYANVKVIKTHTVYELYYDYIEKGKIKSVMNEYETVEDLLKELKK